jgi:hypothetical protein
MQRSQLIYSIYLFFILIISSLFADENNEDQYYINVYLKIDNNSKYIDDLENDEIYNIIEDYLFDDHKTINLINNKIKINKLDLDRYFKNKLNYSKKNKILKQISSLNYFIHLLIDDDQVIFYLKDKKNKKIGQSYTRRKELISSPYLSGNDLEKIVDDFFQKYIYRKVEINNLAYQNGKIFINNDYYGKWKNKQDLIIDNVPKVIDSWIILESKVYISDLIKIKKIKKLNYNDDQFFLNLNFRNKVSSPTFNFKTKSQDSIKTIMDFNIFLVNIPKIWKTYNIDNQSDNKISVGNYLCFYKEKKHAINIPKYLSLKDYNRFYPDSENIDLYLEKKSKPIATLSNLIIPGIGSSYYYGNSYKDRSKRWKTIKYNFSSITYIGLVINSLYSYTKFSTYRYEYNNCKTNYNKLDFTNTANEFVELEDCIINNYNNSLSYKKNYLTSMISSILLNTIFNYFYFSK